MNFIHSRLSKFSFFSCLIFGFFACTKITNTDIGSGLFPPVDGVITKDTVLDVITKNESFDSVNVGFSDDHVLGYTHDPVFGTTTASINFQVAPPFTPLTFGAGSDSLFFDSVVLSLSYKGIWGDSTPEHVAFRVYEMDPENKFTVDSSYNNTISFEKGTELTEFTTAKDVDITKLNDPDTLKTYNENATNQVRIRLSKDFGEKLLKQFDATNAYQNEPAFRSYFRGFIVEPEQQGNALLRISLSDTSTRLSLYYHFTNSTGSLDTAVRRFSPSALTSASSNTIKRNYQGTELTKYFPTNPDTQDNLLFIQTSPGTYARIKVPGLMGLNNVILHRAELLMQQVPDITGMSDTTFTSPNLFLSAFDSGKRFAIPLDVQFSSGTISNLTSFGVLPIRKIDNLSGKTISTYNFDITRYAQSVITKNDSLFDFILWAPYNYYLRPVENTIYAYPISTPALNAAGIGRVRLGGGNNPQYKMRLHIVYSLL